MRSAWLALALVVAACGSAGGTSTTTAAVSSTTPSSGATTSAASATTAQTSTPTTASTPATTLQAAPATGCPVIAPGNESHSLVDVTESAGIVEPLTGMHGHAAAWGDVDGDGLADLFVGTFADRPPERYAVRGADGPSTDALLLGAGPGFVRDAFAPSLGRSSGAVFADLDADGDLDLVAARNASDRRPGVGAEPTAVFRNDGGTLVAVDAGFDASLGGRSIGVLDHDLDGLLDLYIVEDQFRGGSSRLFRNTGDLRFEDVTAAVGLPLDVHGLGVAVGDLAGDARSDLFVSGSNRLFIAGPDGFTEVPGPLPPWERFGDEDIIAGVDLADVDLNGTLDLIVGHHFNSTVDFGTEVPVRLYLNESSGPDSVTFRDVTEEAGLIPLPTKAPHVEFADVDNDGHLDIVTSASAQNGTAPAIFLGTGVEAGIPRFTAPSGLGSDQYWVAAPVSDYDRDGQLDVFLVEWEPALPSLLFAGSAPGNWLSVGLADSSAAPGSTVLVYRHGAAGDPSALLATRAITASRGYSAGVELTVHVGLGAETAADVVIITPDGSRIDAPGLAANARYLLPDACG